MDLSRLRATLLVSVLAAVVLLPPLGQRVLAPSDEARFVLYAREVLRHHAPFDVRIRQKLFREKPPLYAWLIVAASAPGGRVTEATAQLPIVAAALATVVFTFLTGERLFTRRVGVVAALVLLTTYGFFAHSQLLLPDMLVVAFACAAMYAFTVTHVVAAAPPGRQLGFYLATAAAVYAKGPVGMLPFLFGAVWLWFMRGPRAITRLWSPSGAVVFGLISLTWAVPFLAFGSTSFAESVIWEDWVSWYVGRPALATMGLDLLVVCLPWTLVMPLVLGAAVRDRRTPAVALVLIWFLTVFLVLLPIANQRTRYLLPLTPPLALLVAFWAERHGPSFPRVRPWLSWLALSFGGAAAVVILRPQWFHADLDMGPLSWWAVLPFVANALTLGLAFWWGLRRGRAAFVTHGGIAGMMLGLVYGIWPYTANFNATWDVPALTASIERHAGGGDVAVFGGRWFAIDYYLDRPLYSIRSLEEFQAYIARPDRPLVVTNGRTWRGVRTSVASDVCVIDQRRLGAQSMVIIRAGEQQGVQACGTK